MVTGNDDVSVVLETTQEGVVRTRQVEDATLVGSHLANFEAYLIDIDPDAIYVR